MTKYKQYMKERKEIRFDEDYPYLPYDIGGVSLESRDVYATPHGLMVVANYNVHTGRGFYLPNGERWDVWDEDDVLPKHIADKIEEVRIYHDFPYYHFLFDDNDNLVAVRHCTKSLL